MKTNNLLLLAGAGAALLLLKHKKKETTNAPIYDNPEDANRDYYVEWLAEKENGNTDLEYEVWLGQIFPTGAYGIGRMIDKPDMKDYTRVIFRTYPDGEVIALFPDDTWNGSDITSYMHVGQHGGADYNGVLASTRPSTPQEIYPLYLELVSVGYHSMAIVDRKNGTIKYDVQPREWDYFKKYLERNPAREVMIEKQITNVDAIEITIHEKHGGGLTSYIDCESLHPLYEYCQSNGIKIVEFNDWDDLD